MLVVTDPSLGASDARNAGAARATGDVLVFVDADVRVHPDALGRIRAAFDADPSLTALHGSYDDSPSHRSTVSAFRNLLHHHVHQANPGPAETFWTGLGAVRRDAFLAVGGFDAERYPHPSIEDIELGHRLVAAGGTLVLDPTVQGTHLKRWTLRSMVHTDFARRAVPWIALQVRSAPAQLGAEHGLGPPVQRRRLRRPGARRPRRVAAAGGAGRGAAGGAEPPALRAARPTPRRACGAPSPSASTGCTTWWPSPQSRRGCCWRCGSAAA